MAHDSTSKDLPADTGEKLIQFWIDPRTEIGELLWPENPDFPPVAIDWIKQNDPDEFAAQFQQRPRPAAATKASHSQITGAIREATEVLDRLQARLADKPGEVADMTSRSANAPSAFGVSLNKLCEGLGVSSATLAKFVSKANVRTTKRGERNRIFTGDEKTKILQAIVDQCPTAQTRDNAESMLSAPSGNQNQIGKSKSNRNPRNVA